MVYMFLLFGNCESKGQHNVYFQDALLMTAYTHSHTNRPQPIYKLDETALSSNNEIKFIQELCILESHNNIQSL